MPGNENKDNTKSPQREITWRPLATFENPRFNRVATCKPQNFTLAVKKFTFRQKYQALNTQISIWRYSSSK